MKDWMWTIILIITLLAGVSFLIIDILWIVR